MKISSHIFVSYFICFQSYTSFIRLMFFQLGWFPIYPPSLYRSLMFFFQLSAWWRWCISMYFTCEIHHHVLMWTSVTCDERTLTVNQISGHCFSQLHTSYLVFTSSCTIISLAIKTPISHILDLFAHINFLKKNPSLIHICCFCILFHISKLESKRTANL